MRAATRLRSGVSRKHPDAAQSITSAPEPLGADQARRARRYLVQMGVRVLCFLLAALLWQHVPLWVSLTLIVGAVVLPYTAVLFANAGRERQAVGPVPVLPPTITAAPDRPDPRDERRDERPDDRTAGGPR